MDLEAGSAGSAGSAAMGPRTAAVGSAAAGSAADLGESHMSYPSMNLYTNSSNAYRCTEVYHHRGERHFGGDTALFVST